MKKGEVKFVQSLRYLCLVCVCIVGLFTIIGTGGGGDEEGGAPVDTNQPLALNSGNALAVSGLVFESAEGAVTAGTVGTGFVSSAASPGEGVFEVNALHIAQDVLDRVLEIHRKGWPSMGGFLPVTVPPTVDCSSGTITTNWDDIDPSNEVSVGDGFFLEYNSCVEQGLRLNGQVTVGILELTNDPSAGPPWLIKFRLNFDSLTASDGGSTVDVFGTLDVTVDAQATGTVIATITTEVSTGGGPPASSLLHFGEGDDFIQLTLLTITLREETNGDFTLTAQGTLESSLIGGTVTFDTLVDLTGTDFDTNNPSAGQMEIIGAANANILLQVDVNPNPELRLEVDVDGDGFVDAVFNSTWAEMDAAADVL